MKIINLHNKTDKIKAMKGCELVGNTVIVDGREIPKMTMIDEGETIHLILDRRMGINLPRDVAPQVAWLVANALAIGQGYSHIGAASKDNPFAPEVNFIGELT